ncbi:MAG TPA: Omp28-related outer membrane protein [Bacteroidia bacterium]|nr:Omp28-related outer membrane protein [Bacteroidia bacterium]
MPYLKITAVLFAAALLVSCKRDHPTAETPKPGFTKKVLLEKFTTTSCGNCGKADLEIEAFKKQYPGKLISVHYHLFTGQHGGDSMATGDAQDIAVALGLLGTPYAAVNRQHLPGDMNDVLYPGGNWAAPIAAGVTETSDCGIALDASSVSGNILTIKSTVKFSKTVAEPLYLSVFLLEDSITGDTGYWQANYYNNDATVPGLFGRGHPIKKYVHNDVYRAAVTPFWGQAIPADSTKENVQHTVILTADISKYRVNHLKVVAFVHGRGDVFTRNKYKVLNAQEVYVGKIQSL